MVGQKELKPGDRCTVTDLCNGTVNPATVDRIVDGNYVEVTYDTGRRVRVGKGFVKPA